ncbi:hypothetical protein ACE1CD_08520 [Aerosakkonema sp. BLCC-F183]|uniref:hypothetical protein n=1 Tax=Aerosakkonema sp. BLCC-F183 TaxID=3342834 RepID=UPI0035B9343B
MANIEGDADENSIDNNFYAVPEDLKYETIQNQAETDAKKSVTDLLGKLNTSEKYSLSEANQILELEIVTAEMYKNLYLRNGFYKRGAWLKTEMVRISKEIGKWQGGLKFWEGGKFSLREVTNTSFQWTLKAGLSFVTVLSTASLIDPNFTENAESIISFQKDGLFFWLCVFSGISLVELTSASIYNWFTSEPSATNSSKHSKKTLVLRRWDGKRAAIRIPYLSWLKPVNILMFAIWLAEALVGYSILLPIIQDKLNRQSLNADNLSNIYKASPPPPEIPLFLGVSMFALINLIFAYSKAKRDNSVTTRKDRLASYLEYQQKLEQEFEYCTEQAEATNADYQKYKERFIEIIYEKNTDQTATNDDFISKLAFPFRSKY